jgi:hypothetical protein
MHAIDEVEVARRLRRELERRGVSASVVVKNDATIVELNGRRLRFQLHRCVDTVGACDALVGSVADRLAA